MMMMITAHRQQCNCEHLILDLIVRFQG